MGKLAAEEASLNHRVSLESYVYYHAEQLILPKAAWCSGSTLGSYYLLMEPSGPRIETESRYFNFCSVLNRSFYRHLLLTLSDLPASPGHCYLNWR
jgi:hypothetical protein